MSIRNKMMVLMIAWLLPAFSSADMCSWVDKDGIRHFSNTSDCNRGESSMSPEVEGNDGYAERNAESLRFNGVYRDGFRYFRFYGDGTLVLAVSREKPEQLAGWFGKSAKNTFKGDYSISNGYFRFNAYFGQNAVLGEGFLKDGGLVVSFLNGGGRRVRGNNAVQSNYRYFVFIPVDFPPQNRY